MTEPIVKVPGVGPVRRRYVIYGGVAVVVLVAGAYWWRARSGGTTTVVDPSTGSVPGGDAYTNPAPSRTFDPVVGDEPNAVFTDGEWSAAVLGILVELGWDPQFAAVALGKYLDGQGLTNDEAQLVRAAWATQHGRPPSNRQIVMAQTGQTPGDTTPPPPPPPPPTQGPDTVTVHKGESVYALTNSIWGAYTGWGQFETLNPGVRNDIYWEPRPGNPDGNNPVWTRDRTVRIR